MADESPKEVHVHSREVSLDSKRRAALGHFTINPVDWQSSIFTNEVVPDEDSPLKGWRGFGADRLSRELWPSYAKHNPILAYWVGRRRARLAEDLIGLLPWGVLILVQAFVFLVAAKSAQDLVAWAWVFLVVAPVFSSIVSGLVVGMHIRSVFHSLPLEELMTTPVTSEAIVQGLSMRPLAVQAFAHAMFILSGILLVIPAQARIDGAPGLVAFLHCTLVSVLGWMLLFSGNELGGAFGTRAHFSLRRSADALQRMIFDLFWEGFLPFVALPVGLAALTLIGRLILGNELVWVLVAFGGLLVFGILASPFLLVHYLRSRSVAAMQWTCSHPEEWWVNELNEEDRLDGERIAWAPWADSGEELVSDLRS